jgi:hypothetical protein
LNIHCEQLEPLAGRRDHEGDTLRHTGGGLVRQSERLAVPRDAAIEI